MEGSLIDGGIDGPFVVDFDGPVGHAVVDGGVGLVQGPFVVDGGVGLVQGFVVDDGAGLDVVDGCGGRTLVVVILSSSNPLGCSKEVLYALISKLKP